METIVQRLKKYLHFIGVSVSIAEKNINISNGSLSKPFNAGTTIKTDTLEKFLKIYPEINPEWLLTGQGSMLKKGNRSIITYLHDNEEPVEQSNYKDLADARLQIIEMKDDKIKWLENELSTLKEVRQDPILYRTVAESAPELIKK